MDEIFDEVRAAVLAELSAGPMTLSELTGRLKGSGALPPRWDEEEVDEVLLDVEECWVGGSGVVALTDTLLDGVVFSHRLTPSELVRGVLDVTPDLGAIDCDDTEGLALLGGGMLECRYPSEGGADLEDNGSFVGPDGWLASYRAGDVVCFRRTDRTVSLESPVEPGRGEAEERGLGAAFDLRHVEGFGVEAEELVMEALCHDQMLFRTAVAPIAELLERIGLERRGAWFGLRGEDWAPPGVHWELRQRDERRDSWGFDRCCETAFQTVLDAWHDLVLKGRTTTPDLRAVAKGLGHGSVAPAFAEYVLGRHGHGQEQLAVFATELAGLPGRLATPGLLLRALDAEREGKTVDAESDLRQAVLADPEFGPALAELAWYEADRGDAERAVSLLQRAGVDGDDPELEYLATRRATPAFRAGRNDPCPCGSGRKFKVCCLGGGTESIESRMGWLHHKVVRFTLRPARRDRVEDLFEITVELARPQVLGDLLPILVDVAAFEGGGIDEFVEERGFLLPEDERTLARSWLRSRLAMWEVVVTDPGRTVTLRDTRTGDQIVATEHTASQGLRQGQYLLARVVAAGSQHQILGLPLGVELRHRESLIALLDSDPGAEEIANWIGAAFAPPRLTNREGEDTLLCRAVLRAASTPWDQIAVLLDEQYGDADDGRWTETVTIDGGNVVRGFLRREGEDLVVETNSPERFERMLDTVRGLAGDLVTVEEERLTPSEVMVRRSAMTDPPTFPSGKVPPEIAHAVAELLHQKEQEWIDEEIPALGGLTPRDAAADPSRREDLVALLRELEQYEENASGFQGFNASRLRAELGLPEGV